MAHSSFRNPLPPALARSLATAGAGGQPITKTAVQLFPSEALRCTVSDMGRFMIAHLDGVNTGTGATDNAAGVAVMMEAIRILKAAGAAVVSLPSNEIYAAMQTGAMDAALTSSTSLISFRLEEVSKSLTTGRGKSYWFMLEPLMMSKAVFDKLSKEHQGVIMAVGADMEAFARKSAQLDDSAVAAVYQKTGAKVVDLNDSTVKKWQAIARTTAWKDYGERNENCAKLLKLAEKTL